MRSEESMLLVDQALTPSQLTCPKCARPMDAWESNGLALDHCFSCKGLWFDAGELAQHLAGLHARIGELDLSPVVETGFPCPRCEGFHLAQVRVHGVTLDACPRCRGIFLDLGEVHELLGALSHSKYGGDPAVAGLDDLALGLFIGAGLGRSGR
jgi:Zn-finger nucleic acid-binding protein